MVQMLFANEEQKSEEGESLFDKAAGIFSSINRFMKAMWSFWFMDLYVWFSKFIFLETLQLVSYSVMHVFILWCIPLCARLPVLSVYHYFVYQKHSCFSRLLKTIGLKIWRFSVTDKTKSLVSNYRPSVYPPKKSYKPSNGWAIIIPNAQEPQFSKDIVSKRQLNTEKKNPRQIALLLHFDFDLVHASSIWDNYVQIVLLWG